jgi:hypothetical protein
MKSNNSLLVQILAILLIITVIAPLYIILIIGSVFYTFVKAVRSYLFA